MIRKLLVFILIVNLGFPLSLLAKETQGAQILVLTKDGSSVQGELITVKTNSLLLMNSEGADTTIAIENVEEIRILKKAKLLLGGGIGAAAGSLGGALLLNDIWYEEHGDLTKSRAALKSGIFFGCFGLLLGGITGAYAGQDKIYSVAEYQPAELRVVLGKLSKLSRVTKYP